jgi:hypothetical protein
LQWDAVQSDHHAYKKRQALVHDQTETTHLSIKITMFLQKGYKPKSSVR